MTFNRVTGIADILAHRTTQAGRQDALHLWKQARADRRWANEVVKEMGFVHTQELAAMLRQRAGWAYHEQTVASIQQLEAWRAERAQRL